MKLKIIIYNKLNVFVKMFNINKFHWLNVIYVLVFLQIKHIFY